MDNIFVVWYIRKYGDGLRKTTIHCASQHEAVTVFSKAYPDTLIRLVEPVRKTENKRENQVQSKYIYNPYYTIIDNKLYFITRGGEHIYCRDTTLSDYEQPQRRIK